MQLVYSPQHQGHATAGLTIHGEKFPEVPARAEAILAAWQAAGLGPVRAPEDHGQAPLLQVHPADYLEFLSTIYAKGQAFAHTAGRVMADTFATRRGRRRSAHPWAQLGYYCFDIEAPFLAGTWDAAYWSAQCALTAAALVAAGAPSAYALCRPPGHHALMDQAGGFCYVNNAAIAARWLQTQAGRPRVAILDVDYHHGNGTQEIFYADPSVLYVSLHGDPEEEYPFFWGAADERGAGAGLGANVNLPLPKGADDHVYLAALDQGTAAIRAFAPQALVLSLGLDSAAGDPSALGGGFAVTPAGLAALGERIAALRLPAVIVQEGGYGLAALGANAVAVLRAFA